MRQKWNILFALLSLTAFISSGFKDNIRPDFCPSGNANLICDLPSRNPFDYNEIRIPYTGKFFIGYKEAIAFKESECEYSKINSLGCLGKYQFSKQTLSSIGIDNYKSFLKSPKLQEKAFLTLLSKNKWELRNEIEKYCGSVVSGIFVTESGILAAAHLGGVNSVKKFFETGGRRFFRDGYGTSIKTYLRRFGGYETGGIVAEAGAKVN